MFDRHFIDPTGEMTVLQQCDKEQERYNLQLLKVPQAHSEGWTFKNVGICKD